MGQRQIPPSQLENVQEGDRSRWHVRDCHGQYRPFRYSPIEDDFEQRLHVAKRLERHAAGIRMEHSRTMPEMLAEAVLASMEKPVTWPPMRTDGAERAAEVISHRL